MWCLETIVDLNRKAMEMYIQGRHIADSYAAVGINASFETENSDEYSQEQLDEVMKDLQENKDVEIASSRWI